MNEFETKFPEIRLILESCVCTVSVSEDACCISRFEGGSEVRRTRELHTAWKSWKEIAHVLSSLTKVILLCFLYFLYVCVCECVCVCV